ncbi:MAG TPA: hypothetical protein VM242_14610 [Acidimicrobiales bacterium]|jgi:hypothetical protein|nr:hypothetical protein [Acidimicrobiales bacterium]
MELTRQWKIAGATAAVAGLSLGGILSAGADEPGPAGRRGIELRDAAAMADAQPPVPVESAVDDDLQASPDGESLDSPLQSADDSPDGADSLDSPGQSPDGESVDSPAASADDSFDGQSSVDSPEPAAAAAPAAPPASFDSPDDSPDRAPAPARPPAPADDSADSPDGGSTDSAD